MKSSKPFIFCLFISFINAKVYCIEKFKHLFPESIPITESIFSELVDGDIYSDATVSSKNSNQKLNLFVAGIHPQKCVRSFPKLGLLTNYKNYLSIHL
ncbi:hypothetical protein N9N67_09675 [Bacteriovoracaceae bacterium]|nr:hypothetical protein [Bacteriovoracaceae bacterium]